MKHRYYQSRVFSYRKTARHLMKSRTSVQRIFRDELKLQSYRKKVQAELSEEQKAKRLKFANWIQMNFRQVEPLTFFFLMKNSSTSMEFLILRTSESGHQVVPRLMQKVPPRK